MKGLILLMVMATLSACTNHFYQGKTSYIDTKSGDKCEAIVYWTNTTHWFNSQGKPTTVVIKNGSNPSSFNLSEDDATASNERINLIVSSDAYQVIIGDNIANHTELNCGYFEGKQAYLDGQSNQTRFYLFCNKKVHPIRGGDTSGLRAQGTPYIFAMAAPVSEFSWTGKIIPTEVNPQCF